MKESLEPIAFMIGPEEYDDCTEEDIIQFLAEEHATRSRKEACQANDIMKSLWKELFDIDMDALDIDFLQFDMHFPPNVSRKEYQDYFSDVPDGVNEWILGGINHPDAESIAYDAVSAQILLWRDDKLIYYQTGIHIKITHLKALLGRRNSDQYPPFRLSCNQMSVRLTGANIQHFNQ